MDKKHVKTVFKIKMYKVYGVKNINSLVEFLKFFTILIIKYK